MKNRLLYTLLFIFPLLTAAQNNINLDSLEKSIEVKVNDTSKANQLVVLSTKYYNQGKFEKAIGVAEKSLLLSKKINYEKGIADAYNNIGVNSKDLGRFDEALKNLFLSLKIRIQQKDTAAISFNYSNIASVYTDKQDYKTAIEYLFLAIRLGEAIDNPSKLAVAYNRLGIVYKSLSNFAEAKKYYLKALACNKKLNDERGMAINYFNLGNLSKNLFEFEEASGYYQQSLMLNKLLDRKEALYNTYAALGNLNIEQAAQTKDSNKKHEVDSLLSVSTTYFDEARKMQANLSKKSNALRKMDINYGRLLGLQGHYNKGREYLNSGIEKALNDSDKSDLSSAYNFLSKLDSAQAANTAHADSSIQLWKSSLLHARISEKYKYELLTEDNLKSVSEISTKYETEKKDNEIALQKLSLKDKEAALLVAQLQTEKNITEIELLGKTKNIQDLELIKTQKEVATQMLAAKAQAAQLLVEKKDKALKEHELSRAKLVRNILITASLAFAFIGLLLFNRYKLRKQIEQQTQLINQRKHISADLHDDVGSTLSSISIYSEAIKNKLNQNEPEKVMELVHKIGDNARETISNLSDIVWSINPANDKGEVLFNRMESFATSVLSSKDILLDFTCEQHLHALEFGVETKQNLFLIYKEAINNIAKHSRATRAIVHLSNGHHVIKMVISDNGKGFSTSTKNTNDTSGNGLKNMRTRAQNMHGEIKITSLPTGTTTELQFPVTPKR